jgi:hypothetical protein
MGAAAEMVVNVAAAKSAHAFSKALDFFRRFPVDGFRTMARP